MLIICKLYEYSTIIVNHFISANGRLQMLLLLHEFWMLLWLFQNWINDLTGKILGQFPKGYIVIWFGCIEAYHSQCFMLVCDAMSCFTFCSNFSEIFDVNWFTSYLSNDVKIIKQLPSSKGRKALSAYSMRVPRKCNERCYISRILPVLVKKRVSFLFHRSATGAYCAVQLIRFSEVPSSISLIVIYCLEDI